MDPLGLEIHELGGGHRFLIGWLPAEVLAALSFEALWALHPPNFPEIHLHGKRALAKLAKEIRVRMPAAVVFEDVPSFGTSLAGHLVTTQLERPGHQVFTTVLKPNAEWNEIEDCKRWLLVDPLDRPFELNAETSHPSNSLITFSTHRGRSSRSS